MAQLAEQLICNQQVIGSSPIIGFIAFSNMNGGIPEWPKGTDCKSAGTAFGGSNPPSPTYQTHQDGYTSPDDIIIAGQSSLEARRAHNPEVAGSNPVPASMP